MVASNESTETKRSLEIGPEDVIFEESGAAESQPNAATDLGGSKTLPTRGRSIAE